MVMHLTKRPVELFKRAAILSFVFGCLLLAVKFTAYAVTQSTAILSDAVESIVNVITAAFAFYSIWLANKPADEDHPYGHGKIEFFSAALEGGAIIVAAIWIIYKAVQELIAGPGPHELDLGIWLVAFAAVVNAVLGWYLVKIGKREGSIVLEADGKHILTDVYTSSGVVVGLIVVVFTHWYFLDAVIAILVAVNIVHTGFTLIKKATGGIMDACSLEDNVLIKKILSSPKFHDVCSYHKLRHRQSGNIHFVDFHLIFPKNLTIEQAHAVATAVELQIAEALGDASVMAHIEPCKRSDCPSCRERTPKTL